MFNILREGCATALKMILVLFLAVFLRATFACVIDTDCGSANNTAPGLCINSVCQCGFGFAGNKPVDPTSCAPACTPSPVPDGTAFFAEPNVTLSASSGCVLSDRFCVIARFCFAAFSAAFPIQNLGLFDFVPRRLQATCLWASALPRTSESSPSRWRCSTPSQGPSARCWALDSAQGLGCRVSTPVMGLATLSMCTNPHSRPP